MDDLQPTGTGDAATPTVDPKAPRVFAEQRIQTVCLLVLTTLAVAAALLWLRPVMIPFTLALFFTLALSPLIDWQERFLNMPRSMAVLGALIGGFIVFSGMAILVTLSVRQLSANVEAYQAQIVKLQLMVTHALPLEDFGLDPESFLNPLKLVSGTTVRAMLMGTTNAILDLLSQGLLVFVFVLFLLLGGRARSGPMPGVWGEVQRQVQRYIFAKGILSLATGLLVGTTLWLLGIDLALVFGLFAFLLNFIPTIGSVIATLLPLPVVLVSPDIALSTAILALTIPAGIQFAVGSVLDPKITGESLDLHPVAILIALIFWGMLWGVVGMLLAAPITAVMKILFARMEHLAPVSDLLAGRLGGLRS